MIKNFVTKPLFTLSLYIILLIIGLYSLSRLPLDFLPNISIPSLTIITAYPGASAEDVETTVSKVIEDAVATVPDVDKISSDSQENVSTVTLQFKWGKNLDAASADVRDKMDLVASKLPDDAQKPTIFKFDLSQIPVLTFGLSADQSYDELYELADKKIGNSLKRVPGVGTVIISGGKIRQINVDLDKERMEGYRLSLAQVNGAIQAGNISIPAGNIKTGAINFGIRVPGEYTSIDELKNTIVGNYMGKDIFLSDIADVADSFQEEDNRSLVDGKLGVMVQVQKQSGANTVAVVEGIKKQLEDLKDELPPDVKITYINDTAEYISRQIKELSETLLFGFIFVVLTVLFFLRNVRGSAIVSLAMPFSILGAFIYMFLSGGSINIISLASLIISIGIVVDDAIVVLENVFRHMDKKHEAPKEAAIYGASEVSGAVIASTTTNLVIFLPLLLVQGFVGIFFQQLVTITIVTVATSLLIAVSLTPMLSSKILKNRVVSSRKNLSERFYEASEGIFEAVEERYKKLIAVAIDRRKFVIGLCVVIFFLSLPMFGFVGSEFFPEQDNAFLSATVEMPAGTRWDKTEEAMKAISAKIEKQIPEKEYIFVSAGSSARMGMNQKNGPNIGRIYLRVVPLAERKRTLKDIQYVVTKIAQSVPGVKSVSFSEQGANSMSGGGKPVTVEIYGSDFDQIDNMAAQLKAKIEKVPGVINLGLSREKTNPEYALVINRAKASASGLTMLDVAMTARGYIYGTTASKFREGGDEYDIFTRLKEDNRKTLEDIKSVFVTSRAGANLALGNIADVELKTAPQVIQRQNQQRLVRVEGEYYGRPIGDITADVRKIVEKTTVPGDIRLKVAGSSEQMAESFKSLFISMLLGIALIYLVMVAQFESFLEPFIIMFAIPFAIVGVVWSLFLTGVPFGIMSFVGLILVTGVAVKNSIVLVDYTNILRARGLALRDAVQEAGKTRLRPILMTSSAAILGMMPIVLGVGEGSSFWKPMAVAVIGGLMVSATISLLFVPTVYYEIERRLPKREFCGKEMK